MNKKVFKLVSANGTRLYSFNELDPAVMVEYRPGEWVFPQIKGTPLWAFSDSKDAVRQVSANYVLWWPPRIQIWIAEADCAKPFNPEVFKQSPYGIVAADWKRNWKNWRRKRCPIQYKGMVLCGKIKLLERIK